RPRGRPAPGRVRGRGYWNPHGRWAPATKEARMEQRILGRTGAPVSVIGLGTWQLGADWGDVPEDAARAVLDAAYDSGVRSFDTADVYGDGLSERRIGAFLRDRGIDDAVVATKAGRRLPQSPEIYTLDHL